jgi:hypothetical protein
LQEAQFKYITFANVVEIIFRVLKKLNKLQTDVTGYILAGVIWRSSNESRKLCGVCDKEKKSHLFILWRKSLMGETVL